MTPNSRRCGQLLPLVLLAGLAPACDLTKPGGGGGGGGEPNPNFPNQPDASSDTTAAAAQLLTAINQARTSDGLSPVGNQSILRCAADRHAIDQNSNGTCQHEGSDGSAPSDRVADCGASLWSGEIIACGQQTATQAVEGWLASPGHRAILLDSDQEEVGVAVDGLTWVAVFNK